MSAFSVVLSILVFGWLILENIVHLHRRRQLIHVIHVNGTRGKSTVTRLIDAGLRAGGFRVFCKTTGTVPMTIDVQNQELPIKRLGRANIKEQLQILSRAAKQNAQVLVIECMAVNPQLQYVSQHKMLKADISIITNVRPDHLDEMGSTQEEIAAALSSTIPTGGYFFTADKPNFPFFLDKCKKLGSKGYLVDGEAEEYGFDFAENVALALAVTSLLGVDKPVALEGMRGYKQDPYALKLYHIRLRDKTLLFINGFSINDPHSTTMVYRRICDTYPIKNGKLALLVNNRADRVFRMQQQLEVIQALKPDIVWITGGNCGLFQRKIAQLGQEIDTRILKPGAPLDWDSLPDGCVVYAVGNIAREGSRIIRHVEEVGEVL